MKSDNRPPLPISGPAASAGIKSRAERRKIAPAMAEPLVMPVSPDVLFLSTVMIVAGCAFTALFLPKSLLPIDIFRYCSVTMGLTIVSAIAVEARGHVRRVIRIDVAGLLALYILTFGEFLVPNLRVLYSTTPEAALRACDAVLVAFASLTIGRHIRFSKPKSKARAPEMGLPSLSNQAIIGVFVASTVLGFMYVFLSVDFNLVRLVEGMTASRWNRPWLRGSLGDWRTIFIEAGMLLYVVAALGGYILAKPKDFSPAVRVVVCFVLAFLFVFDFFEGTRTFFLIRICLFLAAMMMAADRKRLLRIAIFSGAIMTVILPLSGIMLQMRNIGLTAFLKGETENSSTQGFLIDNNMYSLARTMDVFPAVYDFPGFEIIWISLIHPVPRFLWPSKPEGWSLTIEDALGEKGFTIAVTYVGEAYLTAGFLGVILVSLLLGAAARAWNEVGLRARTNMDLVLYASGFFAALIGMRSMQWITVAILPALAIYFFGIFLRKQRLAARSGRRRPEGPAGAQLR